MDYKHLTTDELIKHVMDSSWTREIKKIHIHHTWSPNHTTFKDNGADITQLGMYNYHTKNLGWGDIGQQLTLFPDGTWGTGRDFNTTPVSISGHNTGGFAIEMVGNFDIGNDIFGGDQELSVMKFLYFFITQMGLDSSDVIFHREFSTKTCPGTSINKDDFVKNIALKGENMNERVNIMIKGDGKIITDCELNTINKVKINLDPHEIVKDVRYYSYCGYDIVRSSRKDTNAAILQTVLNEIKPTLKLVVDGYPGSGTIEGLYQVTGSRSVNKTVADRINELLIEKRDGVAIAPIEPAAPVEPISNLPMITLKKGSLGRSVGILQEKLISEGYYLIKDESFGAATEACLLEFQRNNGLAETGIYDSKVRYALETNPVFRYQRFEYDRQTTVIKMKKEFTQGVLIDVEERKTLYTIMKSLSWKPTVLISGGLFNMSTLGEDLNEMIVTYKKKGSGYYSKEGMKMSHKDKVSFGLPDSSTKSFLGGSPYLLENGKRIDESEYKNLDNGYIDGKHPRTAVGMDDEYIYIVLVRGRNAIRKWYGVTLYQLTSIFLALGCTHAQNNDGGGSTGAITKLFKWIVYSSRGIANALAFYVKGR